MKFRTVLLPLICIIVLTLSACSIENDAVHKIIDNNIDIQTKYGAESYSNAVQPSDTILPSISYSTV